jgi:2-keto-4-pentenoate hydratase/2-oxohepta-3-ene-1,7-dioic acid hydratase in catechol pathway
MKLATFETTVNPGARTWGVLLDDHLLDVPAVARHFPEIARRVWGAPGSVPASIKQMLTDTNNGERVKTLVSLVKESSSEYKATGILAPLSTVTFAPPVPDPGKFLCVGKNSRAHLEELRRNDLIRELPQEPTGFIKLNEVLVGHDAKVARPPGITTLDYEPEMAFAVSRPGQRIRREHAMEYVAGITLFNDLTAREIQKREVVSGTRFWTSKNMPGFGPVGPYLITLDEVHDPHDLWLTLSVNGEQRIRVNTRDYIFRIPDIIEHFSRYLTLAPGDMFSTGVPGGVAVGQPNADELFLRPGDLVEVGFENLAVLRTHIVASTND